MMSYNTNPTINVLKGVLVAFALAIATAACDGPVGPEGPPGPQGEQGERGRRGPDGTANVQYSEWMEIEWNLGDNQTNKAMGIEEELPEDFFESGGVALMFLRQQDAGNWAVVQLPIILGDDNLSFGYYNAPGTLVGFLFQVRDLDGQGAVYDYSADSQIRYVLIPGGVPVDSFQAGLQAELDASDYEAVKAFYGIPDEGAGEVQR